MTYAVNLRARAERDFRLLWRTAANSLAIQAAVQRMTIRLATDPADQGVLFSPECWAIHESPLGALYRIDDDARTVWISELWLVDEAELN